MPSTRAAGQAQVWNPFHIARYVCPHQWPQCKPFQLAFSLLSLSALL